MLSDLGTQVTVLEALPKILPGCDKDVADVVLRSFKKRGIEVRTGVAVTGHTPSDDGRSTTVHFGEGEDVTVEAVVVSVGPAPALGEPGPGRHQGSGRPPGLRRGRRVHADRRAGGVRGGRPGRHPGAGSCGIRRGVVIIDQILGDRVVPVDYTRVPWCIYCHPEVAFAGLSEEAAREAGFEVMTKKDPYGGNGRALIVGEPEGLVKVICEKGPDGRAGRILGVHMVGPWVTEQLGQAYLSVNWEATPTRSPTSSSPIPRCRRPSARRCSP